MKLTTNDVATGCWQKLLAHHDPMLAKLRARIENPALAEADRLPLLYKIHFIKELMALGDPDPNPDRNSTIAG